MASNNRVIVFGASGNVGQFVIPALHKAGVDITVVTRTESKTASSYDFARTATTDYASQSDLVSIIRGHASVISLLSAGVLELQRSIIDAAVEAGATLFIPSEFGHDTTNEDVSRLLPVFGAKAGIIEYLREKEKDGLSWTGIITALFFDWGLPLGAFGIDFKAHKATVWDGGDTLFSAANMDDIAASVVSLVTDASARERYKNQHVYVSSVQTTQNEILAAAEAYVGKKFALTMFDSGEVYAAASPQILPVLQALQLSKRGLSDYQARIDAGHNRFIIDAKRDVRNVVNRVLEGNQL
ncbi:hypothetical protein B0A48_11104 [Cryoendolithus antarcticus]|uniref:NmrA-like domain-containing protein n=1 Tax=Cryoendolithus antarcticus TaxID=1507870 RepID=A0A1V8SUV6_9PEZI|nr:hypothetical protein B0A48_11104 [Cryoendolithus antarcticus]